jgi:hypothetical protein
MFKPAEGKEGEEITENKDAGMVKQKTVAGK